MLKNFTSNFKKNPDRAKYLSPFLKFEAAKNRRKSTEEAKAQHLLFVTSVYVCLK